MRAWLLLATAATVLARPDYLRPAMKFGAQDCSFCHLDASGGEGWNARGEWLVKQKEERNAGAIQVEWLSAYRAAPEPVVRKSAAAKPRPAPAKAKPAAVPSRILPQGKAPRYTTRDGEWPAYAGELSANKYSPLAQIDAKNVASLEKAWTWEAFDNYRHAGARPPRAAGDAAEGGDSPVPDGFKATPLMVNGRMYVRTNYSGVAALDPESGRTLWTFDPKVTARPGMYGFATRGLGHWKGGAESRLLLSTGDGYLIALDPVTGEMLNGFGERGRVDLTAGLRRPLDRAMVNFSAPPLICGDVVIIGNQVADGPPGQTRGKQDPRWRDNVPLGDIRGYDVRTGKLLWVFQTVPQQGEFGNETWGAESWKWMGNTNVWSIMSADEDLGYVYLPVTAPTNNFWGGDRPGENLFATSIVCLDARTGKRVWHFQTVHHDIWDYDLPAAPNLVDIAVEGKPVKAVAQIGKTGFVYVLDRVTGQPVWPIEERPVPQTTLPGEWTARTQPHPTKPPPFEMQGFTDDHLIDFTPELRAAALAATRGMARGPLFTPLNEKQPVFLVPGYGGGGNWGGGSFDPETGYFYVSSRRIPTILQMRPVDPARFGYPWIREFKTATLSGLPVLKPPYGTITAYDLNAGRIAWQIANGDGPRNHPLLKGLNLPPLGNPNASGILVTKSLLFCGDRGGRGNPPVMRAYDKVSGRAVWEQILEGGYHEAPPVTYLWKGKQYVVIATGGQLEPARLTAYRLP